MKQSLIALSLVGAVFGRPAVTKYDFVKREVPQEHAHRNVNLAVSKSLQLDNPDKISDPVFGLLGAKAAAEGAGSITDTDCLQQATADQAFTNAKAAGDVDGMTMALIYRALERNTASVGLASAACTSVKAVNPEVAALQQHQDPASDGAAALNKQIAQTLAAQISAIGGDPTLANEASTFAPGEKGDPTAAGNTCDDDKDDAGCINTQNLRVDDLTAAEVQAAAQGGAGNSTAAVGTGSASQGAAENSNAGNSTSNTGSSNSNTNTGSSANQSTGNTNNGGANTGNASNGNASNGNTNTNTGNAGNTGSNASTGTGAAASGSFGSCPDPTITFAQTPSDGRQEAAFEATDLTNFPHGSAQGIGIISGFICDQLTNKCKADKAAVDACDQADAAVKSSGLTGQAAADSFNQALGF